MVRALGSCRFLSWMPEVCSKACECIGEAFGPIGASDLRQERFSVMIAVSVLPPGEQGQAIRRIAAQIPGALYSNRAQKEQGEQQASANCRTACQGQGKWSLGWIRSGWQGLF